MGGHGWHGRRHEGGPRRGGRRGRGGSRTRWRDEHGWFVLARVERFVEPALLLTLRDQATHGYDLRETLADILGPDQVDAGNLYRLLRSLEEEGVVTSSWDDDAPGRQKRTYELTADGQALLDTWAEALTETGSLIDAFLERHRDAD